MTGVWAAKALFRIDFAGLHDQPRSQAGKVGWGRVWMDENRYSPRGR